MTFKLDAKSSFFDEGKLLFDQGNFTESLKLLSKVDFGEEQKKLAIEMVNKIKTKIEEKENNSNQKDC